MSLRNLFLEQMTPYSKNIGKDEFSYSMHISARFNYVYISCPKVASSSIKYFLIRNELRGNQIYHNKFDINRRSFSPLLNAKQVGLLEEYIDKVGFIFCFTRNPYTRILSCFLDKICDNPTFISKHANMNDGSGLENLTLIKFLQLIDKQEIIDMDPHWRPQYYQTNQDNFDFDFIGKIENYDSDIRKVSNLIGLDINYLEKVTNHSTDSKEKLNKYFDSESIELVNKIYHRDFYHFGYEKISEILLE